MIIGRIIARSISGTITPAEQAILDDWLQDDRHRQIYMAARSGQSIRGILSEFDGFDAKEGYQRFQASIGKRKRLRYRPWMAAAAAILLFAAASVTIYLARQKAHQPVPAGVVSADGDDVPPGGNRATLILADGRRISLDSVRSGIVIGEGNITYQDGTDLTTLTAKGGEEAELPMEMLTLSTPRGGQYQVTLPDGTTVWLNSATTLKYPSRFSGQERVVEIAGEGYFAVTPDKARPFRVLSDGQVIQVLGTEFNVSAYPGEPEIQTTLVKGSIQVAGADRKEPKVMVPGQQSKVRDGNVGIVDVDIDQYIAWKSGMFHFKHTPLVRMMDQIERWYDVEVVYNSNIPMETFSGRMRRDVSLYTVLDLLKVSEITFHVEGKRLIID